MIRDSLGPWVRTWIRLDITGVTFAALFFCLSLTPSLLPRDWVSGGVIGGITAAIGYGIGVLVGIIVRRLFLRRRAWWPLRPRVRYPLEVVAVGLSAVASIAMVVPAAAWQRRLAAIMGIEGPETSEYLRTLLVALLTGGVLIAAARMVKDSIKGLARLMIRRWDVNDEVATFIGTTIVVILLVTLVNGVLVNGFIASARAIFQPQNSATRPALCNLSNPNAQAAQALSRPGAPWVFKVVTSSARVRTPKASLNSTAVPPRSRSGSTPDSSQVTISRPKLRCCCRNCNAPGLRSQAVGDHPHYRNRLGRPDCRPFDRVDVQRRHRSGGAAVLVLTELDLLPRRSAEVRRGG